MVSRPRRTGLFNKPARSPASKTRAGKHVDTASSAIGTKSTLESSSSSLSSTSPRTPLVETSETSSVELDGPQTPNDKDTMRDIADGGGDKSPSTSDDDEIVVPRTPKRKRSPGDTLLSPIACGASPAKMTKGDHMNRYLGADTAASARPSSGSVGDSPSKSRYSNTDDLLILTLRGQGLKWEEVATYFDGRSATAIRLHHDKHLKHADVVALTRATNAAAAGGKTGYSADQDRLILLLKEVKKMKWEEMAALFPGKTATALRLHYAKFKKTVAM